MKVPKNLMVVFVMVWCFNYGGGGGGASAATIGDQCAPEFQKVTTCLTYATGKAETPSKECCVSATDIKEKNPVCLCYIIQQIHTGSNPQLKSMGIQEARLLQLPFACNLQNASSAQCPKLLNLPANSPDAAFFTNNSASATPATSSTPAAPATSGKASPAAAGKDSGNGFKPLVQMTGPVMAIVVAFFFNAFLGGRI